MRIAFINQPWNPVTPPVQAGSIAIWTDRVAQHLAQDSNCQVVVYARLDPGQPPVETFQGIQIRRVAVGAGPLAAKVLKRIMRSPRRPGYSSGWYYRTYIEGIARDLQTNPADIIHIHNFSQFVPVVRRSCPSARIFLHMHSDWLGLLDPGILQPRLRQADLILGCSDHVSETARKAFPALADRCRSIYNGADVDAFAPAASPNKRKAQRLLTVGRISPEKGLHVLLQALPEVLARHPGVEVEIVGPNSPSPLDFLVTLSADERMSSLRRFYEQGRSYLDHLKTAAAGLPVTFTGPVPHGRLHECYQEAGLLVNPAFTEAFGMNQIEAMACELPVAASCVGGIPEVVAHGETGVLFEPDDARELADALSRLLDEPERMAGMGRLGRQRVIERFSWERVAEDYRQLTGNREP